MYDLRDSSCMFKSSIYYYYFLLPSVVRYLCLLIGSLGGSAHAWQLQLDALQLS